MSINISSLPPQLIIGSQDWSAWISFDSGIQIGYPEYEIGKGLMIATGTINLEFRGDFVGLPSSPVYRANANQWRRGQTISLAVGGAFLPCSGQQLYLLKAPKYPNREIGGIAKMSLTVGCRLALENYPPEPNRDVAGVKAGISTDRGLIVANILNFLGIPNAVGSLPYPINYPLPKNDGNWIEFAGKIADSAGYYLRCDTSGLFIAEPIRLGLDASVRSLVIGRDEKLWESIGDVAEQPIEKTILTAIVKDVTEVDRTPKITVEKEQFGITYPDITPLVPNLTLFDKTKTIEISEKINDNLFRITTTIQEQFGVTYPDITPLVPNLTLFDKTKTIKNYKLKDGLVYELETTIQEQFGVTYRDITPLVPNLTLFDKTKTIEIWQKTGDRLWDKITTIKEQLGVTYPAITPLVPNLNLFEKTRITKPDTSGPPTNIGDISENVISDRQISSEVIASQLAVDPFRPRQRTYEVPYAVSVAQLTSYGQLINQALTGRAFGWQFGGVLDAGLLPFQQVSVEFDGIIYYLRVDALQYAINGTEAYLLWNGIEVGTALANAPTEITRPLQLPLGIFEIVSQSFASTTVNRFEFGEAFSRSFSSAWGNTMVSIAAISQSFAIAENVEVASLQVVAYWKFDQIITIFDPVSGLLNRFVDEVSEIQISGLTSNSLATIGKISNSVSLDDSNSTYEVPEEFIPAFDQPILSIFFWLKLEGTYDPDNDRLESTVVEIVGNSGTNSIGINYSDSAYQICANNTGGRFVNPSTFVNQVDVSADWIFVVYEINSLTEINTLEVTGIEGIFTASNAYLPYGTLNYLYLRQPNTSGDFKILIDELGLASQVLSASDRLYLYNSGSGRTYPFS